MMDCHDEQHVKKSKIVATKIADSSQVYWPMATNSATQNLEIYLNCVCWQLSALQCPGS